MDHMSSLQNQMTAAKQNTTRPCLCVMEYILLSRIVSLSQVTRPVEVARCKGAPARVRGKDVHKVGRPRASQHKAIDHI